MNELAHERVKHLRFDTRSVQERRVAVEKEKQRHRLTAINRHDVLHEENEQKRNLALIAEVCSGV